VTSSLLCETVTGRSMAELLRARDAVSLADMVELRLDGVVDLDVAQALHGRRLPVVATCRPRWEGGRFDGSEDERGRILKQALDLGAEHVDLEWRAIEGHAAHEAFGDLVRRSPARVVVSSHEFESLPVDLEDRVRAMRATGAGTVKVAAAVSRLEETLRLKTIARGGRTVAVGMGEVGLPSRLLAARFGSCWTYAGEGVAPGQIPAARMIEDYAFRRVGASTRIFGVVSTSARQSLSPAMHNAAFEAAGIDAVYVPFTVAGFDDFLSFASAMDVEGASITIPFKLDALRASQESDDLTSRVGAANTLRKRDRLWAAANTDVPGFLEALDEALDVPLDGMRAAVLGGGGAARAVVFALMSRGARVSVHARRAEQSQEIATVFGATPGPLPPAPRTWDLLVNCTPLGGPGFRNVSPMPGAEFTGRLVYDLTYGPEESVLLQDARAAGCATLDGLPMLVKQAERQFAWWTGQRPAPGVMEAAARKRLARRGA
jgi:3-dehydroquinate dehydratase/shikimate dehydrogenase